MSISPSVSSRRIISLTAGRLTLQPVGDARLDDVDVVLGELEDALAVLLERRVVLSYDGHGSDPTVGV